MVMLKLHISYQYIYLYIFHEWQQIQQNTFYDIDFKSDSHFKRFGIARTCLYIVKSGKNDQVIPYNIEKDLYIHG